jgi:sec-independent protein translocase protein TatA
MLHGLTGWHLLIVLAVIVLLFGAAKLPALAQSVGKSARLFKGELKAMKDDDSVPLDQAVAPVHPEPRSPAVVADPPPTR